MVVGLIHRPSEKLSGVQFTIPTIIGLSIFMLR
jgi:hypothetical protein